ncbi:alginate lyase family protein [bacterium]|nr:alginate lyase family protein [bacterium]
MRISFLFLALLSLPCAATPETLIYDGLGMVLVRQGLTDSESPHQVALTELKKDAKIALREGPWSVVSKKLTPPSGDPHDYMSVGPYWWPDPKKEDGLPYIRRDGKVNPERMDYDNVGLSKTAKGSATLALAWYFTGEDRYADQATKLLRTWFLDPKTRMNPNLNFGQAIPGKSEGRGIGIIDTVCLIQVVDSAILLEGSKAWTAQDSEALRKWMADYLHWLRTSKNGLEEKATKNNHGTWYDAQCVSLALYTGKKDLAREILGETKKRIASQIEPDGTQPHELSRTKTWDYSLMNLRGFFTLARLAEHLDSDLWNHPSVEKSSLRTALDWLTPFATGKSKWTHKQISRFNPGKLDIHLRHAAKAYPDSNYEVLLSKLAPSKELQEESFQLTQPKKRD